MKSARFGLADLTNSIFNSLTLPNTVDTLNLGQSGMRECLILIDGMGRDAVEKYGENFCAKCKKQGEQAIAWKAKKESEIKEGK